MRMAWRTWPGVVQANCCKLKGRDFNDTDANILMDDMVESLPTEMEALG